MNKTLAALDRPYEIYPEYLDSSFKFSKVETVEVDGIVSPWRDIDDTTRLTLLQNWKQLHGQIEVS